MGLLDWLSSKNKQHKEANVPSITFSVRSEIVETPIPVNTFTTEIAGTPIKAEVPYETKAECEKLLLKDRSFEDNQFLHENYWVNVYFKGVRHGYHGINDLWTYSARDLPELPLIHDWIYSILGKRRPEILGDLTMEKTWEDKSTIYVLGTYDTINVQLSFKHRGYVLNFVIKDNLRWPDKVFFNTKTGQSNFPFYFSLAQEKIIAWAKRIFEKNRTSKRITGEIISKKNNEGWSWLVGFTKWHYFRNGRSLCGSYTYSGSIGLRQENDDAPDKCGSCRRSLLSEKRKPENEKQSNTPNKNIERDGE